MYITKKVNKKRKVAGTTIFSRVQKIFTISCLFFVSIFSNIAPVQADTTQFLYVSTSGSNSNPGSENQPWRTIQYAVDSVDPGDTIFIMGGTYNESIKVQRSGTSTNPIKLTNYNGQTVTINGGSNPALIPYKQLPQYWIVEGLNLKSSGKYTVLYDSWGSDGTCKGIDHWTFYNNYISGSVFICGAYTLFEGNEVDGSQNNGNGGNGVQDAYKVSHHNIFRNNHIHHFSNRGIWSMNRTHDNIFEGNTIHNISNLYCINTDGFGNVEWRHTIRGNYLYNCGTGIYMENTFASVVSNNVIHNTTNQGIGIINYGPNQTGGSYPNKCAAGGENNQYGDTDGNNNCEGNLNNNDIKQNLIYDHGYSGIAIYHAGGIKIQANNIHGSGRLGIFITDSTYSPKITLQSNIISNHSDAEIQLKNYSVLTTDSNNLFYNVNSNNIYKTLVGKSYWYTLSLAQYKSATGRGKDSLQGNPEFVNYSGRDFHLKENSPAIDMGLNVGFQYDLKSNPRPQGNGYDIGAFESPYTQGDVPPDDPGLPAPNLLSPAINEKVLTNRPAFDWNDVAGAANYTIQISKSDGFSTNITNLKVTESTYVPASDLPVNSTIYWRVKANGDPSSDWSHVFSFYSANPPSMPSLSSPGNNELITDLKPRLDWKNSTLPIQTIFDHYQLQVATDTDFSSVVLDVNLDGLTNSEYTFAASLSPNTKYYWRVRAFNTLGHYSNWSTVRSFREAILSPTLLSPVNESNTDSDLRPIFDWQDVEGASGFDIQISTYSSMKLPFVKAAVTSSDYFPTKNLPSNKTLYWRVRTKATNGPSAWSEIWSVSTTPNPVMMTTQSSSDKNQELALLPEPQVVVSSASLNLNPIDDKNIQELATLQFTISLEASNPSPTLNYSLSGAPEGANISQEGNFSWTPTESQGPGSYQFDICASDGNSSDCENIKVTVEEVNAAPALKSIGDLSADVQTEFNLTSTATDVDIPAQPLSFSLSGAPTGASITLDGIFIWTPEVAGNFTFNVCVSDGSLSDCETITITVNESNDEKVSESNSVTNAAPVLEPTGNKNALVATELAFTAAATDPDVPLQPLTFSLSDEPAGASITAEGIFTWTPETAGDFTFGVCVSDGSLSVCETITVTVSNDIQVPFAADDGYSLNEDTELIVTGPGLLANDTDSEGHPLTPILVSDPQHGRLLLNSDGSFSYLANRDYNGSDSFTYVANDGFNNSNIATVNLTITSVNDAPVCEDVKLETDINSPIEIEPDCTDVDNDELIFIYVNQLENVSFSSEIDFDDVNQPENGTLSIENGVIVYLPNADFLGDDSFSYKVSDGSFESNECSFLISITSP